LGDPHLGAPIWTTTASAAEHATVAYTGTRAYPDIVERERMKASGWRRGASSCL